MCRVHVQGLCSCVDSQGASVVIKMYHTIIYHEYTCTFVMRMVHEILVVDVVVYDMQV